MKDIYTGDELLFYCQRWLSRDEDDGEICRELPALRNDVAALPSETNTVNCCNTDILRNFLVHFAHCVQLKFCRYNDT